jgi:serine protease Do
MSQSDFFRPAGSRESQSMHARIGKKGVTQIRYIVFASGLIAMLVIGTLAGSFVTYKTGRSPFGPGRAVPLYIASGNGNTEGQIPFGTFAPLVKSVLPAVVNVSSSKVVRNRPSPFMDDPFFRQFFGDQSNVPRERREHSLGSGVIVSPQGYILTNNHVIEGASEITVVLSDKQEFKARVLGADPRMDIAVLKVEGTNLPVITLGDSSKAQVGDVELAIGNPFGLGQTVTMGIVSATGRGNLGIEDYEDFIQTDAAINPGNSGGALINMRGELIGINTAILSDGGQGNVGIGFAVPISMARNAMEQILKDGKVIRGYMGVLIQEVTPAIAKTFGLEGSRGALVGDVTQGSPAQRAGIARGDIILEINGEPVTSSRALRLEISETAPGTVLKLRLLRDGSEQEVSVTLGELPSDGQQAGASQSTGSPLEGVTVDELTPQVPRQLGLPGDVRGVLITDVQPDSAAADAGLTRGDVIQEVNRQPVGSVSEFRRAVSQAGDEPILLLVNRRGNSFFMIVEGR